MPVAFDTLKAARRLQDEAGFSEKQAGVLVSTLAEGMGENLATKADIEAEFRAVRAEMQASDERTQAGFEAVRAEMQASDERTQADIKRLDERMQAGFAAMRAEMREREQRLITRMGAIVVGGIGIVLASIGIVTTIILTAG